MHGVAELSSLSTCPAAHSVHSVSPHPAYVPASHSLHSVDASMSRSALPDAQNSQADAFVEGDVSEDSAVLVRDVLKRLERQWADYIHYGPG